MTDEQAEEFLEKVRLLLEQTDKGLIFPVEAANQIVSDACDLVSL